jgi:hypothetical protein
LEKKSISHTNTIQMQIGKLLCDVVIILKYYFSTMGERK